MITVLPALVENCTVHLCSWETVSVHSMTVALSSRLVVKAGPDDDIMR